MIAWGHSAVGTGIGLVGYGVYGGTDPITGLIAVGAAGVVSHYITDFIPHGHYFGFEESKDKRNTRIIIIFDLLLSVLVFTSLAFYSSQDPLKVLYVLYGIGGAQLPDILDGSLHRGILPLKGILKLEYKFHNLVHWHGALEKGLPLGLYDIWQLATVLVVLHFSLLG